MARHSSWIGAGCLAVALGVPISCDAQAFIGLCGNPHDNGDAFGPFDYRTATEFQRNIVEGAHFTPSVEMLRKGNSSTIGGDLDYTLNVFPNHVRALYAMTRLAKRLGTNQPPGARYLIECYYDRAVRFAPDDAMARALYGNYLAERGRATEAKQQLAVAEANAGSSGQVIYNLGLAYFELKEYNKAVVLAKKAQELGVQFTGLQQRLQRAGKWPE